MSERYIMIDDDDFSDIETVVGDIQIDNFDHLSLADSESSDVEIITIEDEDSNASFRPGSRCPSPFRKHTSTTAPNIELCSFRLDASTKIKAGDTVELKDTLDRNSRGMHSGDFLRVLSVIQNPQTDEIRLRGYRLRRAKYHHQYFDWKMNELAMVLHVTKGDPRPAFVQGVEDVSVDQVVGIRDCIITSKPYPMMSFRDAGYPHLSILSGLTPEEHKQILFEQGRLVCRCVHISIVEASGKAYDGEVRNIYARESDSPTLSSSSEGSICIDSDNDDDVVVIRTKNRKRRSESAQGKKLKPSQRQTRLPAKTAKYTFGDAFCGVGGASQGAIQAGLHVLWGLDKDHAAIEAYNRNHASAQIFLLDAHDFPPPDMVKSLRVDILHLSPPCCYWSPAHTNPGQNDQANYEAIYTVGPILKKLKPRIATLEQTFGLLTYEEHKKNFRMLINDMHKAGYSVRWKIQDLSEFGLPQRRKRLLIIASRWGTPLPPFPKPTHGTPGSGLERFVSVADALEPLNRLSPQVRFEDKYHQPGSMKTLNKTPYDPKNTFLKGCVTTGGGDNHHFSGKRRYTPREMSLFQSFPYGYQFTGNKTEANKQIGNALPPCMAEAMFRSCAQTLEAFDSGIIDADADIQDLDQYLAARSIEIPQQRVSTPRTLFSSIASNSQPSSPKSSYRHLRRPAVGSAASCAPHSLSRREALFRVGTNIAPRSPIEKKEPSSFFNFLSRDAESADGKAKKSKSDKEEIERAKKNGDFIDLDSD